VRNCRAYPSRDRLIPRGLGTLLLEHILFGWLVVCLFSFLSPSWEKSGEKGYCNEWDRTGGFLVLVLV
jgi:hypothetical protein